MVHLTGSSVHHAAYYGHLVATAVGVGAIFWFARRRPLPKWLIGLLVLAIAAFAVASLWVSRPQNPFYDFVYAYYPAGLALLQHNPAMLRALTGQGVTAFVNIPVVAYLFAPLAALGPRISIAVFTLVGVGLTVASWFLLVRLAGLELRERWLLAFLFLADGPLLSAVGLGNMSYYVLFALVAGLALLRADRSLAAGALLGAAAVIKPPLLIFGVFFLLRRDLRGLAGFAAVGLGTALLSLALFGWTDNLHWFETCIVQFSHAWVPALNVQSFPAFLYRLGAGSDVLIDWAPHIPTPSQRLMSTVLTGLLLLAAAAACVRFPAQSPHSRIEDKTTSETRLNLQYLLTICLSLLSSPLTWSHYYAWSLVPTAFFLAPSAPRARCVRWAGWAAIALVTPIIMWPSPISNPEFRTIYISLIASSLMFGGLLWFAVICWWLARTGGLLTKAAGRRGDTSLGNDWGDTPSNARP